MAEPLQHRTVLRHKQVIAAAMAARSRTVTLTWYSIGLFVGLLLANWTANYFTFWFVQQLPFAWMFAIGAYLPVLVPALFAFIVVALFGSLQGRAVSRAYLGNFDRLGIPSEIEALFEVLPEGLRLSTDRIAIFPRWHAVDTVERGEEGWVISADQLTFFVPHDSFADAVAERTFVAAVVAHLTGEARQRSAAAIAFAEQSSEANEPAKEQPPAAPPVYDPHKASARITRQEASWAGRVGYDRIAHTGRHAFLYPLLAALVGGMLGLVAVGVLLMVLPVEVTFANALAFAALVFVVPLIGGAAGLWAGYRSLGRIFDKAYHAGLGSRGSPPEADCEWEVTEAGLMLTSERGGTTARWQAISEVFRKDAYWIALSDVAAMVIPRRAFADETAERAFLAAVLARLSEVARERSAEAAAFAAG